MAGIQISADLGAAGRSLSNHYTEHFAPRVQDVLPAIFELLLAERDRGTLRSAIRVCLAWAAAGIPVLWRSVTAPSLRGIADASRRQMYADYIQGLHVCGRVRALDRNGQHADDDMLEGLCFPRLRRLRFQAVASWMTNSAPNRHGIVPYLQPRLVALDCPARELDPLAVRQLLVAQCTHLQQLTLHDLDCFGVCAEEGVASSADCVVAPEEDGLASGRGCRFIMALLQCLPSVKMLSLLTLWHRACGSAVLVFLAAHDRLATLTDVSAEAARLRHLLRCVAQPFRSLRHLSATTTADALPLIVAAAPSVVELALDISAEGADFVPDWDPPDVILLRPLAALTHLQKLRLTFTDHTSLSAADVVATLEQLPPRQLRELRIYSQVPITCEEDMEYPLHIADGYTDEDFARLLARQPRLVCLDFMARSPSMSPAAFRTAGEACVRLTELGLSQKCRLSALEGAAVEPLFPQLRRLESREPLPLHSFWNDSDWRHEYENYGWAVYEEAARAEIGDDSQDPHCRCSIRCGSCLYVRRRPWLERKIRQLHVPKLEHLFCRDDSY